MREVMTEKKTAPLLHPNRSRQQQECLKKKTQDACEAFKGTADMRQMHWPARGADGSQGEGEKELPV